MSTADIRIGRLADVEAVERVPLNERLEFGNTYDIFRRAADRFGERPAITFLAEGTADEAPVVIDYRTLYARITQAANLFTDFGIGPGEVVSYLLPNLPETHYAIWGGEAAGIVNAINPLLQPEQIAEIMRAAESRLLVTVGPAGGGEIWRKAEAVRRLYPNIEAVFAVGGAPQSDGVHDFSKALARFPSDRLVSGREIAGGELCAFFHTGGTTGAPKLAQHRHLGEVYEAWVLSAIVDFGVDDVLLLGLPLFHVNAVVVTGLAPFSVGANTVLLSPAGYRNPKVIADFWRIVERYRATFFSAVPTVYSALLDVPLAGADVSSLRYAICGAAPMPVEVFRAFEKRTRITILEGYGLTEGTTASSVNPPYGERRIGSIGLRFPYQRMKTVIVNADGTYRRDAEIDEVGAICINGPNVIPGYRQPQLNKGLFVEEGWLNTGDLGRRDADGYFWLTGRAKDLIIRGGHNIDPALIEEALHRHPAVALAAAVGRPDAYAGEIPVAYVSLKPGASATAEELLAFARETVAERPAAPANIVIMDELPVTAIGKIFKPTLRHDAARRVIEATLDEALAGTGAIVAVEVDADPKHGTTALIRVRGQNHAAEDNLRAQIATALGGFAIRYEVAFGDRDRAVEA